MLCTVLGLSSGKLGFCGNIYLVNFTMDSGEKPFHCQGQVNGFYNKTNICMLWRYIQILSLYTHIVCNEDMNNASHRFPLGAKKKKKCNCGWTSAFIIVKAKHLINETAAQGFKCKALCFVGIKGEGQSRWDLYDNDTWVLHIFERAKTRS